MNCEVGALNPCPLLKRVPPAGGGCFVEYDVGAMDTNTRHAV